MTAFPVAVVLAAALALPPLGSFPIETMEPAVRAQFEAAIAAVEANPADASANLSLGMLFHAYGFLANAEAYYRLTSRALLARVLLARGAFDEAAAQFARVIEADGGKADPITRFYMAEADRQRNQLQGALAGYAAAGGIAQALCGAGRVHAALGDLDAAAEALRRAIRMAPEYGTAHYALGQVLRRQGRLEEARAELALAQKHRDREPPLPDALMERVTALRLGAVESLHRGIDLLAGGQVAAATALLEQAVATDPQLVEAHSQLGAAYLSAGDLERAERSLRRAIDLDPAFADAWYNLGVVAHRRDDYAAAVICFERVVDLRPRHADALLGLGTDLPRVGRAADAVEPLRRAVVLRPGDARGHKRLAAVLSELGRSREAIAVLRIAMERLPADASIAERLAWTLATCPDERHRDPAEAERLARDVVARSGGEVPQALDTLAAALAAGGKFTEAIAAATEARDLAAKTGRADLVADIELHLAAYRRGQAYSMPGAP